MKKILFTTAIISLLFASCDKKPDEKPNEEVKKLPVLITGKVYVNDTLRPDLEPAGFITNYDNQNRFVDYGMSYNPDGTIANCWQGIPIRYSGNLVIYDFMSPGSEFEGMVLELNDSGQVVKYFITGILDNFNDYHEYIYNSNGNIIRNNIRSVSPAFNEVNYTATYTEIPSIFRHVNMPEWVLFLYHNYHNGFFNTKGYMIKEKILNNYENFPEKFTYELDDDGYVTKIKQSMSDNYYIIYTIEYINAK